jgi:hypothetical protein
MPYVNVHIDIDDVIGDIDTDDLVEELKRRRDVPEDPLQDMFRALSFGNEKQALDLLRTYLCDCLGRVLP